MRATGALLVSLGIVIPGGCFEPGSDDDDGPPGLGTTPSTSGDDDGGTGDDDGTGDDGGSSTPSTSVDDTGDPTDSGGPTSGGGMCGDGTLDGDEVCDGAALDGQSCASQGLGAGTLACAEDCAGFDTSGCGGCGDGTIGAGEVCDGADLGGATCASRGFDTGTLACAADCTALDTSGCSACGNGVVEGAEACDGGVGAHTCASQGFLGGTLSCSAACAFDTSGCVDTETVPFPTAGDPRTIASGTLPWNAGDFFEGVRNTSVAMTDQVDVHIDVVSNGLDVCGFQTADVRINGTSIGQFTISEGTTAIDMSYPLAVPIAGPSYTIRYQTVATVASGCGAAGYSEATSTVTFHAG